MLLLTLSSTPRPPPRATDFVFINVHDDEDTNEEKYKPDGGYIPRILFIDPDSGEVIQDAINANGNDKYK